MALRFSERLGLIADRQSEGLQKLLKGLNLPVTLHKSLDTEALLESMGMDKKVVDGAIRFVLAEDIGRVIVTDDFEPFKPVSPRLFFLELVLSA